MYKSYYPKAKEIQNDWVVIDAAGQNLGRLATTIAAILRGKHKPTFSPHMDVGDCVIVLNAEKVTVTGTLTTGDYSVQGLESIIAVERKSLSDLLGCVGQHRERFDREIQRLIAYPVRAIVIEATWADLERGDWQSRITPAAAIGSRSLCHGLSM